MLPVIVFTSFPYREMLRLYDMTTVDKYLPDFYPYLILLSRFPKELQFPIFVCIIPCHPYLTISNSSYAFHKKPGRTEKYKKVLARINRRFDTLYLVSGEEDGILDGEIRAVSSAPNKLTVPIWERCKIHDCREERIWRHLDTFQLKTFIHCSTPRVKCSEHKTKTMEVPCRRYDLVHQAV